VNLEASAAVGLARWGSLALSLCTTVHQFYTSFTKRFGGSISEMTMRPNPMARAATIFVSMLTACALEGTGKRTTLMAEDIYTARARPRPPRKLPPCSLLIRELSGTPAIIWSLPHLLAVDKAPPAWVAGTVSAVATARVGLRGPPAEWLTSRYPGGGSAEA
jgi:hypothetical protein